MKKSIIFSIVLIVVIAGLFVVKQNTFLLDNKDKAIVVNKSYSEKDDFSDKRKISGASENIFIGEVVEEVGKENFKGKPSTQFSVRITQNIKGGFLDDIVVNQQAGYYKEGGKLYLSQYEGDELLKPGKMYLFATSPDRENGWQQIIPKFGNTPISNEQQKFKLIDEFKQAIANEEKPSA
ncbi:hypothetical protein [Neobacillus sp. LXY-4]|uniref:hypothetical protein n=1 Tax=Neobacillus sp. LXY-4 TaxID=3379826 RepID=UPI003EE3B74F